MASVSRQIVVDVEPNKVWAAIRDFAAVQRLAPGFVVDCQFEQDRDCDARVVTFADGRVARELLVDIDDKARRLVYAEPGGPFITRNAAMQVAAEENNRSRVVWVIDLLPDKFVDLIAGNMDKAMAIIKRTLEESVR